MKGLETSLEDLQSSNRYKDKVEWWYRDYLQAPPAFNTASMATTFHFDFGKHNGTKTSGPTPALAKYKAIREAWSSSSR